MPIFEQVLETDDWIVQRSKKLCNWMKWEMKEQIDDEIKWLLTLHNYFDFYQLYLNYQENVSLQPEYNQVSDQRKQTMIYNRMKENITDPKARRRISNSVITVRRVEQMLLITGWQPIWEFQIINITTIRRYQNSDWGTFLYKLNSL